MLWEAFVQAGPVVNVYMPKDRVSNAHQGYAFVEYRGEDDADYAIKVLNMIGARQGCEFERRLWNAMKDQRP